MDRDCDGNCMAFDISNKKNPCSRINSIDFVAEAFVDGVLSISGFMDTEIATKMCQPVQIETFVGDGK
jgi:hypothetical protein